MPLKNILVPTKDFFIEKYTLKSPMAEMHYHLSYEIYYIIDGSREYFIGDRFFYAQEGDFVIVPQNEPHRTAGKGATRILIFFTAEYLRKFFSPMVADYIMGKLHAAVLHTTEHKRGRINQILNEILETYNKRNIFDNPVIPCRLFELLMIISDLKETDVVNVPGDNKMMQIVQYINKNFTTINYIEEIAQQFYISKYHLCHTFSKMLGISLNAYLNMLKIRYACQLIEEDDLSMTEISEKCGFNSSSYFCKVFKRDTGFSPRNYKQKKKNSKNSI